MSLIVLGLRRFLWRNKETRSVSRHKKCAGVFAWEWSNLAERKPSPLLRTTQRKPFVNRRVFAPLYKPFFAKDGEKWDD
jgi:hypothetical protein